MRKYKLISALAEETAKEVVRNEENWRRYLNTASRLYKYPFKEQLLIYAQRPEATACASIEIWNEKMHCWVNKGAKGIALIDQFDRLCQMALKGEAVNYYKHMDYRRKHEVTFSELSEKELSKLFTMDEYGTENHHFEVHGYDIEVKNTLIAEALKELTERKRNVILLSYFMEMSDADIAREMNLVRSTIHEHRTRSLEILRKIMEGIADEKDV